MRHRDEAAVKEQTADQPSSSRREIKTDVLLFAARMRAARAVLGWSQTELGKRAKVTQRAIYRLEKAAARARHQTENRINKAFKDAGVEFEELPNGGFEMSVPGQLVTRAR
jgi:transcriptional regulator with XRE-family HTH domain